MPMNDQRSAIQSVVDTLGSQTKVVFAAFGQNPRANRSAERCSAKTHLRAITNPKPIGYVRPALAILAALLGFLSVPATAVAAASPARTALLCDEAAQLAARENDVPLDVLMAVTRTETGRGTTAGLRPWPWTVNMEGAGRWFASEDEARAYVFNHFKAGARSFDVGCFQINYKWHGAAFRSIDDMFDPVLNAHYAAKFLSDLHAELGDWSKAAGAYHSRTPGFADAYAARFDKIRNDLAGITLRVVPTGTTPANVPRGIDLTASSGPMFGAGSGALGSLVPVTSGVPQSRPNAFLPLN